MRILIGGLVLFVAGLAWTGAGAQQELQPKANVGSGVVTVAGNVKASQVGDWRVAVANVPDVNIVNTPSVAVAAPEFLRVKGSYEITWPDGVSEGIVVQEIGRGGWVRGQGERWINLALARSVQARR